MSFVITFFFFFFFFFSVVHELLVRNKGPQQAFRDPWFDLLEAGRDSGFWIAESLHRTLDTEYTRRDYGIKRKFGSGLQD